MDVMENSDLFEDDYVQDSATILKNLTTAWINEKNSPDLLKYAIDAAECMMEQIEQMDNNLQAIPKDDFRLVPHQMEINRIRYILASYHRCRLEKIETFTEYLIKRDKNILNLDERYMSEGEMKFAEDYFRLLKTFFYENGLKHMPETNRGFKNMEVSPNPSSVVFVNMLRDVPALLAGDVETDCSRGSRLLLPFKDVVSLIENGSAALL